MLIIYIDIGDRHHVTS